MGRGEYTLPAGWEQAVEGWRQTLIAAGKSPATIRLRTKVVRRIAHALGDDPREVTGQQLLTLAGSQPWSNDYRRVVRTSCLQFWDYLGGDNPAHALPHTPESPPRPRPVTDSVWDQAWAKADHRERQMMLLAGRAGLRRAEIARLRHTDLVGAPGAWSIIVRGKGGKQRVVPVVDEVADAIGTGTGFVFPGADGGHISPNWVGKLLSRLLGPGWSGHKLRHRYASRGYAATHNLLAVQTALGHASVATTQRYVQVPDDAVRAVSAAA